MFEAVEGLVAEHAELEQQLGAPETHADARLAKRLNQRYAELSSIIGAWREWQRLGDDVDAARELAAEDAAFGDEAERAGRAPRRRRGAAAPPAGPARPGRRQGRDPRGEVGRGRRGVGAVRRRPAPHVHPVRRDARLEGRDARRHRVRPRRLQVRDGRGEGQGHARARGGAVRPAEVRGRRAPRAAGAGDRVAGPGAHQRRRRPGAAGGRAGRRQHRRERPAHRRLPQQRPGRAERQHHRLRGPDHPPAHRASWSAARTRRASCRTRSRRCGSCARGCWRPRRRRPTPRRARPGGARSAPSTAPSGSAPTTSPRTGSPTTAPATRPTTSTRCSTATCSRCSTPASTPTSTARLEALDAVTARRERAAGRRRRGCAAAGVASPEHDAAELLAHVLGTTRARLALVDDVPAEALAEYDELRRPPGRARAAPAPDRRRRTSATSSCSVGPGVFVPRPGDRAAGGLGDRRGPREVERAGRRRPVHRLGSDRRRPIADEVPGRPRARRRAGPGRARLGRAATSRAPASTSGSATWPTRSTTSPGTVDVVTCNPPYIPLDAWESVAPEARDHDPPARALVGRRRPGRAAGAGARAPPCCCARAARSGAEHADLQGESAPAVFTGTGRWADVRDHRRPGRRVRAS